MDDNVKNAVEYAFNDNASDMRDSLYAAIESKIAGALEQKKVEMAKHILTPQIETAE